MTLDLEAIRAHLALLDRIESVHPSRENYRALLAEIDWLRAVLAAALDNRREDTP